MNINVLTIKAQQALQSAVSVARQAGQQAVEPLHLLAVLVAEDENLGSFLLELVLGAFVRGSMYDCCVGISEIHLASVLFFNEDSG